MPIPGATFAEWLRSPALYMTAADATTAANWGDDAPTSERITALSNSGDTDTEAGRQRTFMGLPMAKEVHQIAGRFAPYIGKVITLTLDRLGYDAGVAVLVLGAADDLATGLSQVTVLRRLA